MNNYISEIIKARATKFSYNMFYYCAKIKLFVNFDHAYLRLSNGKKT